MFQHKQVPTRKKKTNKGGKIPPKVTPAVGLSQEPMLPVFIWINSRRVLLSTGAAPPLGVQTVNEEVADSGELCAAPLRGR